MPQLPLPGDPEPLPIADYDYALPDELIAQTPLVRRDASRLMVLDRSRNTLEHRQFTDIGRYLRPGDLLVVNDTRVMPARLIGRRRTGGRAELLLLRRLGDGQWEALAQPSRRLPPGASIEILDADEEATGAEATVLERGEEGRVVVALPDSVESELGRFGRAPLPPYIRARLDDPERYQTVYAAHEGSAAAPTAGLHFTPELLEQLTSSGVRLARVTLHVGIGTFVPVKVEDARQHRMHAEWFQVSTQTLQAIRETRAGRGRVIAVGTTSCRTLESLDLDAAGTEGQSGWTDIYITPGYRFKVVDALLTNFHLPKSTLLLLVSAFAGRERILGAYRVAVERRYRFFSFGDAMLIL